MLQNTKNIPILAAFSKIEIRGMAKCFTKMFAFLSIKVEHFSPLSHDIRCRPSFDCMVRRNTLAHRITTAKTQLTADFFLRSKVCFCLSNLGYL